MKKKMNPTLIGAFVIGAILIAVGSVAFLASGSLFQSSERFVAYFDESVNGLDVGAPVKFKGVRIGRVVELNLYYDEASTETYVPVVIEINLNQLSEIGVANDTGDAALVDQQMASGLRAQLQVESLISGLLFVDLDIMEAPRTPRLVQQGEGYVEIPTIPSPLSEIGQTASDVATRLAAIDLRGLNDSLKLFLHKASVVVEGVDPAALSEGLLGAASAVQDLAGSDDIRLTLAETRTTLEELRTTIQTLRTEATPVLARIDTAGQALTAALETVQATAERTDGLLSADTPFGYDVTRTLEEMSAAARAIRNLAEYLERNPRALLSGKPETFENP